MNLLGTLICGVWAMFSGYAWYSNALFAKPWMKLADVSAKDMKMTQKEMMKMFGGTFLLNLLVAFLLATFFLSPENTLSLNLLLVFSWWFIFTLVPSTITNLYNRKPFKLTLINTGYQLVSFLGFGVILTFIR